VYEYWRLAYEMSTTTPATTTAVAASQGPTVIIVSAIFLGLNVFFISLRAVVKARIAKNFGINDVAMMVAVVCPCGPPKSGLHD
jgi:hypothetical protein